jgi:hypothetical protein
MQRSLDALQCVLTLALAFDKGAAC